MNFRYEILEKSGEGDLFTVYRTRDKVLNRLVAVKALKEPFSGDQEFVDRLIAQARTLIPIHHPNLTRVLEAEAARDAVYIAEEHVRGIDLKERIRRIAPFTVSSAVDVAAGVASGLQALHQAGIIHGALRPQKVLVGPEGEIKVTGAGVNPSLYTRDDERSYAMMRAAHYTAPEVFEDGTPDERSDIYALGIILYEMLTGSVPFDAESPIAIANLHAKAPIPSPRRLNTGVPRAVEGLVFKCLAKDPLERYQSMRQLLVDLKSIQESLRVGRSLSWSPEDRSPEEEADLAKGNGKDENLWKGLLKAGGLVLLVAAVVFAGFLMLVRTDPADVTVPDIIGLSLSDATMRAEQLGLRLVVEREDYSDEYDSGEIYFASPSVGTSVKRGSVVKVYVSLGQRNVRVPGLVGMSESDALKTLEEAGLRIAPAKREHSATAPLGTVIAQDPRPGLSVDRNTALVILTISLGPNPAFEEPEPPESARPEPPKRAETRKLSIKFPIPEGESRQVQIVVKDDTGEWTALDGKYDSGQMVDTTITVTGRPVEIRTYLDGVEVDKQER